MIYSYPYFCSDHLQERLHSSQSTDSIKYGDVRGLASTSMLTSAFRFRRKVVSIVTCGIFVLTIRPTLALSLSTKPKQLTPSPLNQFTEKVGESALNKVSWFGSQMSAKEQDSYYTDPYNEDLVGDEDDYDDFDYIHPILGSPSGSLLTHPNGDRTIRSVTEIHSDTNIKQTTDTMEYDSQEGNEENPNRLSVSVADRLSRATAVARAAEKDSVDGLGGSVYNANRRQLLDYTSLSQVNSNKSSSSSSMGTRPASKEKQVWEALSTLEKDMQILDRIAGQKPQLSFLEFALLSSAVFSAASGPFVLGGHITEFLAPCAAAFTAAIGISAEYTGKVAVADGKEVAASAIQCAAEAESFLANAERAKAIIPLCVGVGATSATLALLVPVLLDTLNAAGGAAAGISSNLQLVTEVYLCCPLISVLAAAVASLALQETRSFSQRALGVGNRRFAKSGLVSRTWLSSTELIDRKSRGSGQKWRTFVLTCLPAPLIGALVPGALPTKTIVVAALAAAESAYFLTLAEATLARGTDAVALKARSAAVCDTYANQGARSAAILPFTSALSSLCAAATAAIVELPFLEALTATGAPGGKVAQMVCVSTFPFMSALFAAAASVSKARCEVDADAAMQAASTIALQYEDDSKDPVLNPLRGVKELIMLMYKNSIKAPFRRFLKTYNIKRRWRIATKWMRRESKGSSRNGKNSIGAAARA